MISDEKLKEFKDKLNKKIYFDFKGDCRIGILVGLIVFNSKLFYCISYKGSYLYIDIDNQIKLL